MRVGQLEPQRRKYPNLPYFLARAVVGQQLSTLVARTIWARVEQAARANGSSIPAFFCEKHRLVLRQCGISRAKVRALIAVRAAADAGVLSVRRLRKLSHVQRSELLCEIWGIGQWTADMTSIFYFADPDVWPAGDGGVQRAFCMLTRKRSKLAQARIARAFAPYRSFLALYMWRVLDQPKKTGKQRAPTKTKVPV